MTIREGWGFIEAALKLDASHAETHYNMKVLYEQIDNDKSAIHFY